MNILIGSAAGVCGTVFSDQVLVYHLPPCAGIGRLIAAPAHVYIGCCYAAAATGSAPIMATAAITTGVLFAWHPQGLQYITESVVGFLDEPERHLKNLTRQTVSYVRSFASKTEKTDSKVDGITPKSKSDEKAVLTTTDDVDDFVLVD